MVGDKEQLNFMIDFSEGEQEIDETGELRFETRQMSEA
jgi:hypothetical protein